MVRHLKEAKPKSLKLFTSRGSIYCMGVADKLQSFERGQCCEKHQYLKSDHYLLHTDNMSCCLKMIVCKNHFAKVNGATTWLIF